MNFQESLDYLYSLGNEVLAMKLGLENIEKLFAALGNPEKKFLKIQIAGTNGKGSTCAFIDAICISANVKTGLFTSPHLVSVTERIKISGEEISAEKFAFHTTKIRNIAEKLVEDQTLETLPTFFEQITAIAISAFEEAGIELAILETGLGGRFDATTAAKAEIVAITPIDFDHQEILGHTLSQIAAEKAAIVRENTKVVLANQPEQVLNVILSQCKKESVAPVIAGCQSFREDSTEIGFKTKNNAYPHLKLALNGEHQRENACVAINLAEILIADFDFQISKENIIRGLESAKHAGRLEWWKDQNPPILFDGAHNVAGAVALKNYLQKYCRDSKITFVFGTMRDKDAAEIAEILFPLVENLVLTEPANPRAASVEDLKKIAENFLAESKIFTVKKVSDAVDAAAQIAQTISSTKQSFVCITGSLYLIGEAQAAIKNKSQI